jgi:SH3 domain-containing YSC84-like protein 1
VTGHQFLKNERRKLLKRFSILAFILMMLISSVAFCATDSDVRLQNSAEVLDEILNIPEGIPKDLLDKAECVVVIPSVKKLAFGVGGSYGRGAMVCRGGEDFKGPWGAPAMYRLEGGSFGLQLGGQESDFVLLIMNPKGVRSILKSKVKLGADLSAAAGPKGRNATAETDVLMRTEILSYSRSRGLFAGISLAGSTLRPDEDANRELYRSDLSADQIIEGKTAVPKSAERLVGQLQKVSPKNLSD